MNGLRVVRSGSWKFSVWMSGSGRKEAKLRSSESQSRTARADMGLSSGDQSAVEPPGPIPNPEVKRRSADGSETIGLVRVGRRQVYARLQVIKHSESGSFLPKWRSEDTAIFPQIGGPTVDRTNCRPTASLRVEPVLGEITQQHI